jgi:hypothetical protein
MEMLRKLTIRTCGFDTATVKMALGSEPSVSLLRIAGIAQEGQPGQTDKGEYLKLKGEFRAVNMVTGEMFEAATAILPSFITDRIAAAIKAGPVEFALEIGVKSDPSSVTGYQYTAQPLVDAKPSDRLAGLLQASGMNHMRIAAKAA